MAYNETQPTDFPDHTENPSATATAETQADSADTNNVTASDTFNAIAGCDKTINTCIAKFNNAVNFRGEPYVPGMDKMLATSATSNDLQSA